MKYILNNARC